MTSTQGPAGQPRAQRRWSMFALFATVPVLLLALALGLSSEYRRFGTGDDESVRAHSRQLLISELFSSIKDAETGQRGFVITGNDAFLAPYREGRAEVWTYFGRLQQLPTSGTERQRLDRMRGLVQAKFDEMERVITARRERGGAAAADIVSAGRGKALMDTIRRETAAAKQAEADTLARTLAAQNQRTRATEQIMWIVVLATSAMFFLLGGIWWRNEQERQRLEHAAHESATRRQAIFDSALDALVLINPSGSIETINRAASRLFGHPETDLIRRDISLLVDIAPGEGAFLDRIGLRGDGTIAEPFRHRLAGKRADGTTLPVEAALGTMDLPDGTHVVAALRDISEREKAEAIKDQFLSTVSHELRTPLTSIVGSLGLLRGGISGELQPGAQRLIVIAENNANRLIRLVNDLLDMEKFESGAMSFDFAPIDLRDAAAKALDAVRGVAERDGVLLAGDFADEAVTVRGDSDRLVQVMTNLLANAVRFTPAGGQVSLKVQRRAGHAEATVADQGPGIDAELRGRLFTRFAQSIQSPADGTRGTGLGLAISREIVRNHGGSIWYDPAPAGGSLFSFSLPLWNSLTAQPDMGGAPRVLICACDNEARAIADALENRSIRADVVATGADALSALRRHRYLTLLLDCNCPGIEGEPLLHEIRTDPATRRLPIIAIAANGQDSAELASLELVDWMPRPIDPGRLNEALGSVMERAIGEMPLVLHVEDDSDMLELTASALQGRARMARATDIASARAFIADNRPDVVIVDLGLPDGSGEELIADLALPGSLATPVIIYSAQDHHGEFAREVSAVLTKSKRSLSALVETITDILDEQGAKGTA